MTDTIVVGFLPTPTGRAALQQAKKVAKDSANRLVVINSSRADLALDPALATAADLTDVRETLTTAGVEHEIEQAVHRHNAADELVAAAVRHQASLVVIGLRHRSLLGRVVFGSTAQSVLTDAPCSVLAVKLEVAE